MKKFLALFIVILAFGETWSQINATTETGKKVILNEDFTWEYAPVKSETESIPREDCNLVTDKIDAFTKDTVKSTAPIKIINYTPESLSNKSKYKSKGYIQCQSLIVRSNSTYAILLAWTVRTQNAYKSLGAIRRGSKAIFMMENDETIEIQFLESHTGDANYSLDQTTYKVTLIIPSDQMDSFRTIPIKKIRMYWSKGYQDYDIIDSNAILSQINCTIK